MKWLKTLVVAVVCVVLLVAVFFAFCHMMDVESEIAKGCGGQLIDTSSGYVCVKSK